MDLYKKYLLELASVFNDAIKFKSYTKSSVEIGCDFAQQLILNKDSRWEYLIKKKKPIITGYEKNKISGLISLGFFDRIDENIRETALIILMEMQYYQNLLCLQQSLKRYDSSQTLFQAYPHLLAKSFKCEMLYSTCFTRQQNTNIVKIGQHYAYLNSYIPIQILNYLDNRRTSYYARINSTAIYDHVPPQRIAEEKWREPNPKWKSAIGIKNNHKDGFSYYIPDDVDIKTNKYEYWDKNVRHIERLEGEYRRNKDGYFSMMIEEIKKVKHPFDDQEFYLIGRMIHLDSAEDGSAGMDSKLKHIDIAINLYDGEDAYKRYNCRLEQGEKIVDATMRSHLLRINDTALSNIIPISTFFESESLTQEWLVDMFNQEKSI